MLQGNHSQWKWILVTLTLWTAVASHYVYACFSENGKFGVNLNRGHYNTTTTNILFRGLGLFFFLQAHR